MYNKLFTKILDSSIWLEPPGTRIVWMTLIAAMDEDGMTQFASVANLAHRARIPGDETARAVTCLESPDPNSSDPDFEGRRIERVPGGWLILNAGKYRDLVTRVIAREQTRIRVARYRAKAVTECNASVTPVKRDVTPSEAPAVSKSSVGESPPARAAASRPGWFPENLRSAAFKALWEEWEDHCREKISPITHGARRSQLGRCEREGEPRAILAIRFSLEKNAKSIIWDFDQPNQRNGTHSKPTSDRNAGTCNAGNSGKYADYRPPA